MTYDYMESATDCGLEERRKEIVELITRKNDELTAILWEIERRKDAKRIKVACPQCEGSGQGTPLYGNSAAKYKCPTCGGEGFLMAMPWEEKALCTYLTTKA